MKCAATKHQEFKIHSIANLIPNPLKTWSWRWYLINHRKLLVHSCVNIWSYFIKRIYTQPSTTNNACALNLEKSFNTFEVSMAHFTGPWSNEMNVLLWTGLDPFLLFLLSFEVNSIIMKDHFMSVCIFINFVSKAPNPKMWGFRSDRA